MNLNQFIKTALIFSFIIFGIMPVFAVPPEPTPICNIEGTIKSVEFKDAYNEPCLSQPNGCPPEKELNHPARYFFEININSVSYISGTTEFNTCKNMYPVDSVQTILINKDKVNPNDRFILNNEIEGIVTRSLLGSSFNSYNLKSETNISKPVTKESIIFSPLIITLGIAFIAIVLAGIIYKIISSHKKLS